MIVFNALVNLVCVVGLGVSLRHYRRLVIHHDALMQGWTHHTAQLVIAHRDDPGFPNVDRWPGPALEEWPGYADTMARVCRVWRGQLVCLVCLVFSVAAWPLMVWSGVG